MAGKGEGEGARESLPLDTWQGIMRCPNVLELADEDSGDGTQSLQTYSPELWDLIDCVF